MSELDMDTRARVELAKVAVRLRILANQIHQDWNRPTDGLFDLAVGAKDVFRRWGGRVAVFLTDAVG